MDGADDKTYWDERSRTYDANTRKSGTMHEQVVELITAELGPNTFVLDVGTGTGDIPLRVCGYVRQVQAIDFSPEMIACARRKAEAQAAKNVSFSVEDSCHLPFGDSTFDVVIAANVLHVVPNPTLLLAEAMRVLKGSGILLAATYAHGQGFRTRLLSWVLEQRGAPIYTRFNSMQFAALIDNSGFRIQRQLLIPNVMPVAFVVAMKSDACLRHLTVQNQRQSW